MSLSKYFEEHFATLTDPRKDNHNKRHLLMDILVITILAVISGAEDWVSIERLGYAKEEWLKTFLKLPNGIPSHDTFGDLFLRLDPKQLQDSAYETLDGDHGRVETRRYWVTDQIDWLENKEKWNGLRSIGMVESERHINGEVKKEKRYYITSIAPNAERFAECVRGHWQVENNLHWSLDVSFHEDDCRVRKGFAAENLAVIRHIALNLLKQEKTAKVGIANKRRMAGWDNQYLAKVLATQEI